MLHLTQIIYNTSRSCFHLPLPYVRASQAARAVSTVGKSSKDFPLPIFPALMASTNRDASCARLEPFSLWVCGSHSRSVRWLPDIYAMSEQQRCGVYLQHQEPDDVSCNLSLEISRLAQRDAVLVHDKSAV